MGRRLTEAQFLLNFSILGSKLGDRPLLGHGSLINILRYKKTAAIVIGPLGVHVLIYSEEKV